MTNFKLTAWKSDDSQNAWNFSPCEPKLALQTSLSTILATPQPPWTQSSTLRSLSLCDTCHSLKLFPCCSLSNSHSFVSSQPRAVPSGTFPDAPGFFWAFQLSCYNTHLSYITVSATQHYNCTLPFLSPIHSTSQFCQGKSLSCLIYSGFLGLARVLAEYGWAATNLSFPFFFSLRFIPLKVNVIETSRVWETVNLSFCWCTPQIAIMA